VPTKLLVLCASDIQLPHDLPSPVKRLHYKSVFPNLLKQKYHNLVERVNSNDGPFGKERKENYKKMIGAYYYVLNDETMRTNY
jgi:hypothetical protein